MIQIADLRKVTVLSKSESMRIKDQIKNVDREQERRIEEAKKREALHLQSKEVVQLWSNTIAGQRRKKLEAKAIREEAEEEKRKQLDIEEAKYKEDKRKEAIEKAKTQLFYQTDRVKRLHSGYLLSHVLKEREAQIELKQQIKSAVKNVDKTFLEASQARQDEALRREEEKARQKKEDTLTVAEEVKKQIKSTEFLREQEKLLDKKEGEEIEQLVELQRWEDRMKHEEDKEEKKNLMQARQEHLTKRQLEKDLDEKKLKMEEEQRKLYLAAKHKMTKLRRDKEKEIIRETQMRRERISEKIVNKQQEQAENEELRIARAVYEMEVREAQLRQEEEERKAAMMESIAAHRESMRQKKERMVEETKQKNQEMLLAKKEADRIYDEKLQLKTQRNKEQLQRLQEFHTTQMAQKYSKQQKQRKDQDEFVAANAQVSAEEEHQFQLYAQDVIGSAAEAKLNLVPLYKAAREGLGGGAGPAFNGAKSSYVVQDSSGAQMPIYSSRATQNVKMLNEAVNIEQAKKRLGFSW